MPRWLKTVLDLFRLKCSCRNPEFIVRKNELQCMQCNRPVVNWKPDQL